MEGYEALYKVSGWVWLFASIGTTSFPVLYAFSNWRQRFVGRALMMQSIAVAFAVVFTTVLYFFPRLGLSPIFLVLNMLVPFALGVFGLVLTLLMWELNHPLPKKRKSHEEQGV